MCKIQSHSQSSGKDQIWLIQTKPDYTNQCIAMKDQPILFEWMHKKQSVAYILIVYFVGDGRGECGEQSEGKNYGERHGLWGVWYTLGGQDVFWEGMIIFGRAWSTLGGHAILWVVMIYFGRAYFGWACYTLGGHGILWVVILYFEWACYNLGCDDILCRWGGWRGGQDGWGDGGGGKQEEAS